MRASAIRSLGSPNSSLNSTVRSMRTPRRCMSPHRHSWWATGASCCIVTSGSTCGCSRAGTSTRAKRRGLQPCARRARRPAYRSVSPGRSMPTVCHRSCTLMCTPGRVAIPISTSATSSAHHRCRPHRRRGRAKTCSGSPGTAPSTWPSPGWPVRCVRCSRARRCCVRRGVTMPRNAPRCICGRVHSPFPVCLWCMPRARCGGGWPMR